MEESFVETERIKRLKSKLDKDFSSEEEEDDNEIDG